MVELRSLWPGRRLSVRLRLVRPCSGPRWIAIALFCVAVISGCVTPRRTIDEARLAFAAGRLDTAQETFRKLADRPGRFAYPAQLDLAMVELAAGDPHSAERRLRKLRDHFDAAPEFAIGQEAASLVTDDTLRRFQPAGYEEVMIRAMLAVCSLAGDAGDAESYTLQAMSKQSQLAQAAERRGLLPSGSEFQPIAIAPYLRGVVREATHRDYDDATRAYQLVSQVRPEFLPIQADLQRVGSGVHSSPGYGVLYVLACVGRGPQLVETTAPTTSMALTLASAMVSANQSDEGHRSRSGSSSPPVLPNIAAVKVPQVVIPASRVAAITARVDGTLLGASQTLTDVGELAERQLDIEMPWTIARAVARRMTKESAVASTRNGLGIDGVAGSLFQFAAATAWSASESADTRCWGLLPREIQVLRAELPAGSHRVELAPIGVGGVSVGAPQTLHVSIEDGRNRFLIAIAPDRAMYVAATD